MSPSSQPILGTGRQSHQRTGGELTRVFVDYTCFKVVTKGGVRIEHVGSMVSSIMRDDDDERVVEIHVRNSAGVECERFNTSLTILCFCFSLPDDAVPLFM